MGTEGPNFLYLFFLRERDYASEIIDMSAAPNIFCAEKIMDVDRVRLEEKRIVPSNTFYCRRDEHPVYFEMTLTRDDAGLTSASFSPINKDVVILDACLSYAKNDQEATVFNNIRYQKSYVKEKLTAGQVRSLDLLKAHCGKLFVRSLCGGGT